MKETKMKLQYITLALTALSLPAFAAESHEGMHKMPDGTMMKDMDMSSMEKPTAAAQPAKGDKVVVAKVNGLVCDFCAQSIKKTLMKEPGVTDVQVDLTGKTVTVGLKADASLEEGHLKSLLKDAGYDMTAYKVQ